MEIKEWSQQFEQIWVINGTVFKGSVEELKSGIEIPDECFRIEVREDGGRPKVMVFIFGQGVTGEEPLPSFLVSVDQVEADAGIDVLSDLPDGAEKVVEAERVSALW